MTNTAEQSAFNLEPGAAERDRAIKQVTAHAAVKFIATGRRAIKECCVKMPHFTSDDVWARIPESDRPHERRAMAAIMKHAEKNEWATPTTRFSASIRREAHRGPKRVWESLIYDEATERNAIIDAFLDIRKTLAENEYPLEVYVGYNVTPLPSYEVEQQEPEGCKHYNLINLDGRLYCPDCSRALFHQERKPHANRY